MGCGGLGVTHEEKKEGVRGDNPCGVGGRAPEQQLIGSVPGGYAPNKLILGHRLLLIRAASYPPFLNTLALPCLNQYQYNITHYHLPFPGSTGGISKVAGLFKPSFKL